MKEMNKFKGAIFDLDGVLVDTAKYHYLAWRRLAKELGFDFCDKDNELLKGVSRMRSLEILLEIGGIKATAEEKLYMAERKNGWYVEYLLDMKEDEILPGARELLEKLQQRNIEIALGSASRNAPMILEKLRISGYFDAIIDGNKVSSAKPDPKVFLKAAGEMSLASEDCIVFEDARAGIEAAKAAGMYAVGVGSKSNLPNADMWVDSLLEFDSEQYIDIFIAR